MLSTTKGMTGVTMPTDEPTRSMEMAMGTVRRVSTSEANFRRWLRKDDLVTIMLFAVADWRVVVDPVSEQAEAVVASAAEKWAEVVASAAAKWPEAARVARGWLAARVVGICPHTPL